MCYCEKYLGSILLCVDTTALSINGSQSAELGCEKKSHVKAGVLFFFPPPRVQIHGAGGGTKTKRLIGSWSGHQLWYRGGRPPFFNGNAANIAHTNNEGVYLSGCFWVKLYIEYLNNALYWRVHGSYLIQWCKITNHFENIEIQFNNTFRKITQALKHIVCDNMQIFNI